MINLQLIHLLVLCWYGTCVSLKLHQRTHRHAHKHMHTRKHAYNIATFMGCNIFTEKRIQTLTHTHTHTGIKRNQLPGISTSFDRSSGVTISHTHTHTHTDTQNQYIWLHTHIANAVFLMVLHHSICTVWLTITHHVAKTVGKQTDKNNSHKN